MMPARQIVFLLLFVFNISFAQAASWVTGGIYSVPYESGQYIIIKVLKTDSIGVDLKLYANQFDDKPITINDCELSSLEIDTEHVAISYTAFNNWGAEFIQQSQVSAKELEAFNDWFNNDGGFSG